MKPPLPAPFLPSFTDAAMLSDKAMEHRVAKGSDPATLYFILYFILCQIRLWSTECRGGQTPLCLRVMTAHSRWVTRLSVGLFAPSAVAEGGVRTCCSCQPSRLLLDDHSYR